ncbi:hypothetical protein, partial [Escherichia coli]|uniref:hypothetical protein n=1 Tax=Escherichia coli TaxID=562 RepID=UPI003EDF48AA
RVYPACDALSKRLFRFRQVIRKGQRPAVLRGVGVMQTVMVIQGNPEEVRELIDATPFAKKYTSGVLSFAEKELPPGGREKVMA